MISVEVNTVHFHIFNFLAQLVTLIVCCEQSQGETEGVRERSWEGNTCNGSTSSSRMLTSSVECNYHIRYKLQIFFRPRGRPKGGTFLIILCGPTLSLSDTLHVSNITMARPGSIYLIPLLLISYCYRLDISDGTLNNKIFYQ